MDFRGKDHNVRRNLFCGSMAWLKITPLLPSVMCSGEKKAVQFMTELLGNSIKTPLQVIRGTGRPRFASRAWRLFWKPSFEHLHLHWWQWGPLGNTGLSHCSHWISSLGHAFTLLILEQDERHFLSPPHPHPRVLSILLYSLIITLLLLFLLNKYIYDHQSDLFNRKVRMSWNN